MKKRAFEILRLAAFAVLRWSTGPWFLRVLRQRRKVTILLYHDPGPECFARHVEVLRKRYTIIPLRQYVQARKSGTDLVQKKATLVLTLDDGHMGNYRLRNVVRKLGVPLTIFLTAGIINTRKHFWFLDCPSTLKDRLKEIRDEERLESLRDHGFDENVEYSERQALDAAEIDEMKDVFDFQSHTITHPILPGCGIKKVRNEICGSREILIRRFGFDIYAFAYPNGNYSEHDVRLTQECGYTCAVTLDHGYNNRATDLFRLTRIVIDDDDGINALLVKASGMWGPMKGLLDWWGTRVMPERRAASNPGAA